MKVAVYQTNPTLLDVKANLEDVISKIHQGKEKGARLIAFPELALTGYFVGHRYHEAALRLDSKEIQKLVAATKGTAVVVGFIEESPAMNFYNSALVAADGRDRVRLPQAEPAELRCLRGTQVLRPGKVGARLQAP